MANESKSGGQAAERLERNQRDTKQMLRILRQSIQKTENLGMLLRRNNPKNPMTRQIDPNPPQRVLSKEERALQRYQAMGRGPLQKINGRLVPQGGPPKPLEGRVQLLQPAKK